MSFQRVSRIGATTLTGSPAQPIRSSTWRSLARAGRARRAAPRRASRSSLPGRTAH